MPSLFGSRGFWFGSVVRGSTVISRISCENERSHVENLPILRKCGRKAITRNYVAGLSLLVEELGYTIMF
jgi:hypothetical protein